MRTIRAILGLAVFSATVGMSLGAEEGETSSPHVADLAWLLGDWEGKYALPDGFPDLGPAGAEVTTRNTWQWTLDKNFMSLKIHDQVEGGSASSGFEILGHNNDTGKLGHWFFGSRGFHGSGDWSRQGDVWSLKWKSSETDGKKYEGVSEHIQIDDDTYTWQMKTLTENGKDIPDWPKVTYRRELAAAPDEDGLWQAFRAAAGGTWQGEGTLIKDFPDLGINEGDQFTMRFSLASAMNGKALVGETQFETVDKPFKTEARVLAGWDPALRQVQFLVFWGGGLVEEITLTRQRGTAFLGMYTAKSPGSPTLKARVRVDYKTPDSYVITLLDGPKKGHKLSSWKRAE